MAAAPSVAIIGPTGFIGGVLTPVFLEAASKGELAELRLLTTDVNKPKVQEFVKAGAGKVRAVLVDYGDTKNLQWGLTGIDVLVSAMGAQGDYSKRKTALVDAAAKAGVKMYFPSEWGTNHTRSTRFHPIFEEKQHHVRDAQAHGLKVVAVYISLVLEICFCKRFGIDSAANKWVIPGDGTQPMALTSQADIGKFALRAVLLAHYEPDKVATHLEVYSDNRSYNEYADIMEQASGLEAIQREYLPLDELVKNWDAVKDTLPTHMLGPLIPVMAAEGVFDHSNGANEFLNPNDKYFTPKTVDVYAKEVNGQPWYNSSPF